MSIGYWFIYIGLGFSFFFQAVMVLDYKVKPRYILPVCICWYSVVGCCSQLINKEVATIVEILLYIATCAIFLKGNFWRNYFILVVEGFTVSLLFCLFCLVIPPLNRSFVKEEQSDILNFADGLKLYLTTVVVSLFVAVVFGKVVNKRYYGKANIYRFLVLAYTAFAITQVEIKGVLKKQDFGQLSISEFAYIILVILVYIIIAILTVSIYDMLEKKRIQREKNTLRQYVKNAYVDLKNDAADNSPHYFYGNILLDSVIRGYMKFFDERKVVYEIYVQPDEQKNHVNYELMAIVDNLLSLCTYVYDEAIDDFFVKITVRNNMGMVFVKGEFSKRRWIFKKFSIHKNKEMKKSIQMIVELLSVQNGYMYTEEKTNECEIGIMMPLQADQG